MSPRASWAKWVIPIRTDPSCSPGVRNHSCSVVYFRSSGYKRTPVGQRGAGAPDGGRLLPRVGFGVLRLPGVDHALDVERGELLDLELGTVVLELVRGSPREGERAGQRVRLADDVDDERRREQLPVDG